MQSKTSSSQRNNCFWNSKDNSKNSNNHNIKKTISSLFPR